MCGSADVLTLGRCRPKCAIKLKRIGTGTWARKGYAAEDDFTGEDPNTKMGVSVEKLQT